MQNSASLWLLFVLNKANPSCELKLNVRSIIAVSLITLALNEYHERSDVKYFNNFRLANFRGNILDPNMYIDVQQIKRKVRYTLYTSLNSFKHFVQYWIWRPSNAQFSCIMTGCSIRILTAFNSNEHFGSLFNLFFFLVFVNRIVN